MKRCVLIVDDEPAQRQLLLSILKKEYDVVTATDGAEARALLEERAFDLVITDERMPHVAGTELVVWVRENLPETPVVVLTAFGSIETAVEVFAEERRFADDRTVVILRREPD